MKQHIYKTREETGAAAARAGAECLAAAKAPSFIVATGASQFETLAHLTKADLDWPSMTGFHLDEYIGMPVTHPASFHKYLAERFISKLPRPLRDFHFIDGESDPAAECQRVGNLISRTQIEVAFVGIGENGHLAFNDPPADFETTEPYLIVDLNEACRKQQFGEGWFPDLDSVPKQAISISIREILRAKTIICTVPDQRKAEAVRNAVTDPVTPEVPASILQTHPDCRLFLDKAAASLL